MGRPARKLAAVGVVVLALASTGARQRGAAASSEALTLAGALNEQILASRSATLVLESWCREHRLADDPRVMAHLIPGIVKAASPETRRRLGVAAGEPVKYRRVELRCGAHVLSDADNWYVPARLTAAMNRLLETTETPFGKAVVPLEPYRRTFAKTLFWTDRAQPMPDVLFEHRAVLYTRDGTPFSEVAEFYRRELLSWLIQSSSQPR